MMLGSRSGTVQEWWEEKLCNSCSHWNSGYSHTLSFILLVSVVLIMKISECVHWKRHDPGLLLSEDNSSVCTRPWQGCFRGRGKINKWAPVVEGTLSGQQAPRLPLSLTVPYSCFCTLFLIKFSIRCLSSDCEESLHKKATIADISL